MKKSTLCLLLAGSLMAASCGSNQTDSKAEAKDVNKERFDSLAMEEDTKFAVSAADAGMMEVQLGKLAQANSNLTSVKKFAQQMVDEHNKVNDELKAWAVQKNVTLPATLSNSNQRKYDDFAKQKGTEFDKAYASFMVDDHKMDIDAFRKEADKGKDAALRTWASQTLPTLEHHLMMAQEQYALLQKKTN